MNTDPILEQTDFNFKDSKIRLLTIYYPLENNKFIIEYDILDMEIKHEDKSI